MKLPNWIIKFVVISFGFIISSACSLQSDPAQEPQVAVIVHTVETIREVEVTRIVEVPVTVTQSPIPAISPNPSDTPTITPTPSITPFPSITPTFDSPNVTVVEQTNCRYGPGAAYLYEYGLYSGDRYDVVGRNQLGTWVYLEPKFGGNRCWAKTSLLNIEGDIFQVVEYYSPLPFSQLYKPPASVTTSRDGDTVTIGWSAVYMTEDDYRGYLLELWLCQDGQIVFTPIHSDEIIINVTDEDGCFESSSGRLYTAEKHGYTFWVPVPWPSK